MKDNIITIENKKATFNYFVEDTIECGIVLSGNEIKSIRSGMASLKESWVAIESGKVIIKKLHITQWGTANKFDVDENRNRELLLHKKQIAEISRKIQIDGYTLIPVKMYINNEQKCKILLGICKGKHMYDKRQSEKDKQTKRDIERTLKCLK